MSSRLPTPFNPIAFATRHPVPPWMPGAFHNEEPRRFDHYSKSDGRVWFEAEDGTRRPGKQGLAIRQELLPELLKALHKAEQEAGL